MNWRELWGCSSAENLSHGFAMVFALASCQLCVQQLASERISSPTDEQRCHWHGSSCALGMKEAQQQGVRQLVRQKTLFCIPATNWAFGVINAAKRAEIKQKKREREASNWKRTYQNTFRADLVEAHCAIPRPLNRSRNMLIKQNSFSLGHWVLYSGPDYWHGIVFLFNTNHNSSVSV